MHPLMPDANYAVIENQYRMNQREREVAQIRLAQLSQVAEDAPAALPTTQNVSRFRRSAAAIAALFTLR